MRSDEWMVVVWFPGDQSGVKLGVKRGQGK
jgi:hypothetical protein